MKIPTSLAKTVFCSLFLSLIRSWLRVSELYTSLHITCQRQQWAQPPKILKILTRLQETGAQALKTNTTASRQHEDQTNDQSFQETAHWKRSRNKLPRRTKRLVQEGFIDIFFVFWNRSKLMYSSWPRQHSWQAAFPFLCRRTPAIAFCSHLKLYLSLT